jgi:hypothetical protein
MTMQPFARREIRFCGLRPTGPWTLKVYSVAYGDAPFEWGRFEPGLQLAESGLPPPDDARGRPGLGLLIAHRGRTGDYVVLGFWDRENELPLRIFVRDGATGSWRAAADDESVCVWDLEIIWAERQAWVTRMMGRGGSDAVAYLASRL